MAKGNLFQGTARGAVGDVVFTRLEGQQVARMRNRKPANPRTNAQLYQRAIMATVMQAYSAGKEIFDHSFEGYSVGAQNQRRFISLNTKRLRAALAEDLTAHRTNATAVGRFVGPGVSSPVPFQYKISEGSLSQGAFSNSSKLRAGTYADTDTVSAWMAANDIVAGDLYTFIFMQAGGLSVFIYGNGETDYDIQKSCAFSYVQLMVKSSITTAALAKTMAEATFADVFEVVTVNFEGYDETNLIKNGVYTGDNLPLEGSLFASGVIRSKENEGLRSTCFLTYPTDIEGWAAEWGLTSANVLDAWKQGGTKIGDSDLILEGANFTTAAG